MRTNFLPVVAALAVAIGGIEFFVSPPKAKADACSDYNQWRTMGLGGTVGEQLRAKCAMQSQSGSANAREKACTDYANAKMLGVAGGSIGETLRVKCYGY